MDSLYARCRDALVRVRARASFAEVHGVLCGRLCAPQSPGGGGWLDDVLGDEPIEAADLAHFRELLAACLERSARELGADGFEFSPLLPDDDESLAERCVALGEWCGGFLYGLGTAGAADAAGFSPDVREALADLGQLARLGAGEDGPGGDEGDYAELVEFVRVAVMSVYEERAAPAEGRDPAAR